MILINNKQTHATFSNYNLRQSSNYKPQKNCKMFSSNKEKKQRLNGR